MQKSRAGNGSALFCPNPSFFLSRRSASFSGEKKDPAREMEVGLMGLVSAIEQVMEKG